MSEFSGKFPKREKKKAETRKKIINASLELFFERPSSDDVKMEEVAERAGIHVQTLYRHFPTKVSLMLAGDQYYLDKFEVFINDPMRDGNTFMIWREWLKLVYAEFLEDEEKYKNLNLRKLESMSGIADLWRIQTAYEDILCASFAKDFAMNAEGVGVPRLVAGMLLAGNAANIRRFTQEKVDFMSDVLETIKIVEDLFSHLIVHKAKSA
ncbi:MAG: TetR/AcrR family transcriptional regulator [Pseudomonadota bacterium]